jgi:aryl-alcohol dehydrogenase-like predicted oxidoreductase
VPPELLGRTNRAFPPVWLSLSVPRGPAREGWLEDLVDGALEAGTVVDVSNRPGLWGGKMRGTDALLMTVGGVEIENAVDEGHAANLLQANLIENLCAVGRECLDFYFLRVRRALDEAQLAGALRALEMARAEGHVRYIGLCCDGPGIAVLGAWQFHDAFEVLLVPRNHYDDSAFQTLEPVARERRVGVVTSRPLDWGDGLDFTAMPSLSRLPNLTRSFGGRSLAQAVVADLAADHPVLVGVRSASEVAEAIAAPLMPRPEGLAAVLQPFREAYGDDGWRTP